MDEIRKSFHQTLDDIRQDMVQMAALVTESIPRATEAMLQGDMATAQAIVELSRQPALQNQTFHLLNPQPTSWHEVVRMVQGLGYPLQLLPYDDWYHALSQAAAAENSQALHSLLLLLPHEQADTNWTNDWVNQTFDLQRVAALLRDSAIACPRITEAMLERLIEYASEHRLFAAPALTLL